MTFCCIHPTPQPYKLLSPLPFCSSPVTRPSPGGLPSWSFHFQSIPRTTLLPTFRCFSICERMRRRWRRKAASTSRAALPGHRDQQGFSDLASFSPAVTTLEDDCSGPVGLESIYKQIPHDWWVLSTRPSPCSIILVFFVGNGCLWFEGNFV